MKIKVPNLQVAIDGPVAAGKGTTSKLLAGKLGVLYVDTGAMYRALTYYLLEQGVDCNDEGKVSAKLSQDQPKVSLCNPTSAEKDGRLITVFLNSQDVSWGIRTERVSRHVSVITRYKVVRDYVVPQQQALASSTSVVMEGRDITTRVLPQAQLKIYLDANEKIRAQRRYQQMLEKGELVTFNKISQDLHTRDEQDLHREIDPLVVAKDAWVLDTSDLTIPQVVDKICGKLQALGLVSGLYLY